VEANFYFQLRSKSFMLKKVLKMNLADVRIAGKPVNSGTDLAIPATEKIVLPLPPFVLHAIRKLQSHLSQPATGRFIAANVSRPDATAIIKRRLPTKGLTYIKVNPFLSLDILSGCFGTASMNGFFIKSSPCCREESPSVNIILSQLRQIKNTVFLPNAVQRPHNSPHSYRLLAPKGSGRGTVFFQRGRNFIAYQRRLY
jgi:hypothetical protein